MKVEVRGFNKVSLDVPFEVGGVYQSGVTGSYYVLNHCRNGGFQLNGAKYGGVLDVPLTSDEESVRNYLNTPSFHWAYVPNAKLVIEE